MRHISSKQKAPQYDKFAQNQAPTAGPDGMAIAPPASGMDSFEHLSGPIVQAKMTVTSASDATETEADQIAKQVLTSIQHPMPKLFQPHISTHPAPAQVSPKLQTPVGLNGEDVSGDVAAGIQQAKGSGGPFEKSTRESMEQAFGADFSKVRIHTGGKADTLNRSLQARAFTSGSDIFFRRGEYNPHSDGGKELIAHELTHVIQQRAEPSKKVNRAVIQRDVYIGPASTAKTPVSLSKINTWFRAENKKVPEKYVFTDAMNAKLQVWAKKGSIRFESYDALYKALVVESQKVDEVDTYLTIGDMEKGKPKTMSVNSLMVKLRIGYAITEKNFPGLKNALLSVAHPEPQDEIDFSNMNVLTKSLRTSLWIDSRLSDVEAPETEAEKEKLLAHGIMDLQQLGVKYTKPLDAKKLQPDFWESPDIAPYIVNCWQTVLLAAYRQHLIDHSTFVLADEMTEFYVGHEKNSGNVLAEAIYQSCGENKIEWNPNNADESASIVTKMNEVEIPEGWVVVIGRTGWHVGVSTGKRSPAERETTIKNMDKLANNGHEWVENNTREDDDKPMVSDLRVSTLEDSVQQFNTAGGLYWAPLPTKIADYMAAKDFIKARAKPVSS